MERVPSSPFVIVIDDPLGVTSAGGILADESRRFPGGGCFWFNDHTFTIWARNDPRGEGPPSLQVTWTDQHVLVEWCGAPGGEEEQALARALERLRVTLRGYRIELRAARPEETR